MGTHPQFCLITFFFSHAQHVGVGKVDCKTVPRRCSKHGYRKAKTATCRWVWCINCHRDTKVNFKDNAYYDKLYEIARPKSSRAKLDYCSGCKYWRETIVCVVTISVCGLRDKKVFQWSVRSWQKWHLSFAPEKESGQAVRL